jgi:iron complex transport system substrate-binding protein
MVIRTSAVLLAVTLLSGAARGETLTYKDKLGRAVRLEVPVQRAVIYQLHEFLPPLKAWDKVVGIGRFAYRNSIMLATKPDIASVPSGGSGTDLNIESLLKVKPDVVITWSVRPENVRFMEEKGLKVITVYPDSIREMYDVLALLGKLFGREKEAAATRQRMDAIFELVRTRAVKVPPNRKAKVLWTYSRQNSVAASDSLSNDVFRLIGAENAAGGVNLRTVDVSMETILKWNPDAVFVWGTATYRSQDILDSSQWRGVQAVQKRRVYKAPVWSTWSPCLAPIVLWVAAKTYPELYRDVDVHAVTDKFFRDVYGIPMVDPGVSEF